MNPVQRHYGDGHSGRPPGATDSGYWRHEYQRVTSHFDRCEVVRRAAGFLASLLEVDPDAPRGELTEDHVRAQVLIEGQDWPLVDVARKFHQESAPSSAGASKQAATRSPGSYGHRPRRTSWPPSPHAR
jgi:hypothetical protein